MSVFACSRSMFAGFSAALVLGVLAGCTEPPPGYGAGRGPHQAGADMGHSAAPEVPDSGPKPSKADVVSGLRSYYQRVAKGSGVRADTYDELARCMVDRVYASATVRTAYALQRGALTRISAEDGADVANAAAGCATELGLETTAP